MDKKAVQKFLKKINRTKNYIELASTISEGFMNITDAAACWSGILDAATNQITSRKSKSAEKFNSEIHTEIKNIKQTVLDLYENFVIEDIYDYFTMISYGNKIILPITYKNNFAGYIGIISSDTDFHNKHSDIADILLGSINARYEIISLIEEKKRTQQERTEFLAGISHEFKTPLNSIIGFSDILAERTQNPQDAKYLENISQSSMYLMELIQNILDYSHSEYKPLELKLERIRPKQIIENTLKNFEEIRKEKNIIFNYTLGDIIINADATKLKQVIYNLISNAIKFSKENSTISIVTYVNEKQEFIFEIQDKGDGINKKDNEKIFNFFTQINKQQMNSQQGQGIGLALCKKILHAHRGDIFVKSKPRHGSTFWFSIPVNLT